MDLQAILNESDSSFEGDEKPGSSNLSDDDHSHHVDLERLLREDDDDNDGHYFLEERTNMSMSTISTAGHHYHLRRSSGGGGGGLKESSPSARQLIMDESFMTDSAGDVLGSGHSSLNQDEVDPASASSKYSGMHNADDWAVLQQILGEEDEGGDEEDPLASPVYNSKRQIKPESTRSRTKQDVDIILNSIDDQDNFENLLLKPQPLSHHDSPPPLRDGEEHSMTQKLDTSFMSNQNTESPSLPSIPNTEPWDPKGKRAGLSLNLCDEPLLTLQESKSSRDVPSGRENGDISSGPRAEVMSTKALAYAEAYEQRLLRPSQRDIVSPLMVKRRLKPNIELGSRMQQQSRDSTDQPHIKPSFSGTSHNARFGFSGIIENKVMPGLTAELQKETPAKVTGLPTALAVNSKFIAIGTQHGVILVFDLFEVLRHQLGRLSQPDGSWNAGQGGSVTSIDLADNGEALIAGYTSGAVVLWDVIKGTILKKITDTHPSAMTAVRFLPDRELKVVTVDAAGLVNKLHFSKNILWANYSVDTECLLDGTAGQILAMNVLPPLSSVPHFSQDGPSSSLYPPILKRLVLLGLSSERSSFAVAVEPTISVLHRWARPDSERIQNSSHHSDETFLDMPEDQSYLPCLSWGWALVSGGGHVVTPILARAWGCCVQLLRASFPTFDDAPSAGQIHWPAFGIHDEFQVSAPIVALEWLGERSLVQLSVTNELMVVDTVMMTLVERLDFSGIKLVYAEFSLSRSAYAEAKGETSGDSSDNRMGEVYCSTFLNSIRSSDNRLLVLCRSEVKRISLFGARQRITGLEEDGEWLEALALALDHYENTIKSQEDRKRDPDGLRDLSKHPEFVSTRRTEDEEWIAKLLIRYLNLAVENAPEAKEDLMPPSSSSHATGKLDLAQSHFQMLAGVCIEFCVVARRLDLLFGPIFRRFQNVRYLSIFLDVLEPYVLNDKLSYIAPEAMAYFVEHCKATSGIATVERCLLHMDVTIMDFDSILSLLRRNEMHSALCYVYTHGLDDFVSPLEVMLDRVFDAADEGSVLNRRRADGAPQNVFERVGYKTIVYLQYCLQGKNFPQGTKLKPEDKLKSLRPQLLRFLMRENYEPPRRSQSEVVGHRKFPYPYTRILLMVDARAFLDTIGLALDAPDEAFAQKTDFESIGGWEVEVGGDTLESAARLGLSSSIEADTDPERQQIISMLSSIIFPDNNSALSEVVGSPSQNKSAIDAFLDFIATYLLQGVVRANRSVTFLILSRMATRFEHALRPEDREGAQKQIIELLTTLPRNAYDPEEVLQLMEKAGVHRAALVLHQQGVSAWHEGIDESRRRSHHFRCVIDCYLEDSDPVFQKEVFSYVKKECASGSSSSVAQEESLTANLRAALCSKLQKLVELDPILSAQLVAELYIEELDDIISVLADGDENVEQFKFLHSIISGELVKVDPVAGPVLNANLTMNHHQIYLELLAKLYPDKVYNYLSTHDNYRPEECLSLCQRYDIADASAYLLERMGNVSSALQLILQKLEGRLMGLKRTMRGMSTDASHGSTSRWLLSEWNRDDKQALEQKAKQEKEIDGVKRILVVALDLCDRNSGSTSRSEHGSQLWFNTLDRLINAKGFLRLPKEQPVHAKAMAGFLGELLQMTMQRMVSRVPLPDLVRKVTTDHSGSRLGELREMIESLLGTFGSELQMCSKAVRVMNYDMRSMESENRRFQMEGCRVRSVMNHLLTSESSLDVRSSDAFALVVDQNGDASLGDDLRPFHAQSAHGGFVDALHRLKAKRQYRNDSDPRNNPWTRPQSGLNMMSGSEQLFNAGESFDGAQVSIQVGRLGEAEHFGSFR